jgi:hypothetical protein
MNMNNKFQCIRCGDTGKIIRFNEHIPGGDILDCPDCLQRPVKADSDSLEQPHADKFVDSISTGDTQRPVKTEPNCVHLLTGDLDAPDRNHETTHIVNVFEKEITDQMAEIRAKSLDDGIRIGIEAAIAAVETLLLDVARDGKQIAIVMCAIARISALKKGG